MQQIIAYLEKNSKNLKPLSGSKGSAGFDILAAENKIILPGETVLISTDLKIAIPNGYEIQIRPRSGLSLKTSLRIPNSPGTIDSDYRNEIKIICQNANRFDDWQNDLLLKPSLATKLSSMKQINYFEYLIENKFNIENRNFIDLNSEQKLDLDNLIKDEFICNQLKSKTIFLDEEDLPYGSIKIKAGERFAQMIFARYFTPDFKLIDDVSQIGENRGGGFGSTGKN